MPRVYCSGGCGRSEMRPPDDPLYGYLCASCAGGKRETRATGGTGGSNDGGWCPALVALTLIITCWRGWRSSS